MTIEKRRPGCPVPGSGGVARVLGSREWPASRLPDLGRGVGARMPEPGERGPFRLL